MSVLDPSGDRSRIGIRARKTNPVNSLSSMAKSNVNPVLYLASGIWIAAAIFMAFTNWEKWNSFKENPPYAVSTAIVDFGFAFDKYLARYFINNNTELVARFATESKPVIPTLVINYSLNYRDKPEILRLIRLLAKYQANVNASIDGVSALHMAISYNQPVVVEELLSSGADVNRPYKSDVHYCTESNALEYAMCVNQANLGKHKSIVKILLDHNK